MKTLILNTAHNFGQMLASKKFKYETGNEVGTILSIKSTEGVNFNYWKGLTLIFNTNSEKWKIL